MTLVLEVQNVSVTYGDLAAPATVALDDVSFSLAAGRTMGVAGESGAGKSTLARAIIAMQELKAGRVLINGTCVASSQKKEALRGSALRQARRSFQILFQDPSTSLNPRMTVGQIVAEGALVHGLWSKREVEDKLQSTLAMFNLPQNLVSRFPNELSGGERRRVALARVTAVEPKLLILDEPTAGLDAENVEDLLHLLTELGDRTEAAQLVISHDLRVLEKLCDEILVMRHGQVVESAETEQFFQDPQSEYSMALIQAASGDVAWVGPKRSKDELKKGQL